MRDMMRWVFNIFALLSFLLCVATVVLWVRSYSWRDLYGYEGFDYEVCFVSTEGLLEVGEIYWQVHYVKDTPNLFIGELVEEYGEPAGVWRWEVESAQGGLEPEYPNLFGIGVTMYSDPMLSQWLLSVPHFWLAYIFAGLPILWCFATNRRVRVKRRLKNNLCVACGYDLQGSGGACPECGTERLQST